MSIIWLTRDSDANLAAFEQSPQITTPSLGDATHLKDHTWLSYASVSGLEAVRYEVTKREDDWIGTESVGGVGSGEQIAVSNSRVDSILSSHEGTTAIVEVDSNPGRLLSSEYSAGEKIVFIGHYPIKYSIGLLFSYLQSSQEGIAALSARLEALENPTNPE